MHFQKEKHCNFFLLLLFFSLSFLFYIQRKRVNLMHGAFVCLYTHYYITAIFFLIIFLFLSTLIFYILYFFFHFQLRDKFVILFICIFIFHELKTIKRSASNVAFFFCFLSVSILFHINFFYVLFIKLNCDFKRLSLKTGCKTWKWKREATVRYFSHLFVHGTTKEFDSKIVFVASSGRRHL